MIVKAQTIYCLMVVFYCSLSFSAPSTISQATLPLNNESSIKLLKKTTIYSETTFVSRYSDIVNSTKISRDILSFSNLLKTYVAVTVNQDSKTQSDYILNDNYVSAGLGLATTIINSPLQIFIEGRAINKEPGNELRAGAVLYDYSNIVRLNSQFSFFSETYGESIYVSRLESDVFSSLWSRVGHNSKLGQYFSVDAYVEGFLKSDRLGYYYENLSEVRPGLRTSFKTNNFSVVLSYHYGFGKYTGPEYKTRKPSEHYLDPRTMLVIYGEF